MSILKQRKTQLLLLAVLLLIMGTVIYIERVKIFNIAHAEVNANTKYRFKAFTGNVEIERDIAAVSLSGVGPTALDSMSCEQLAGFRVQRVEKYRQLGFFRPGYDPFSPPHNRIYKSITPGAPWLYSVPYYVANPYLLIILVAAHHVTPIDIYVPELAIRYRNGIISETIRGASARAWMDFVYSSPDYPGQVRPIMVNAWDAGFYYIYLDLQHSRNVRSSQNRNHVSRVPYCGLCFFHVGRYKKNNLSPESRHSWMALHEQNKPTYLYFKLWRKKPEAVNDPADLIFIFDIDPGRHEK